MSQNLLNLFTSNYNLKIHGREVARRLKLPQKTTQIKLNNLERNKILISEIEGKNKIFSLNIENEIIWKHIEITEIEKCIELQTKYFSIKELQKLSSKEKASIIIFGSFAIGEENKNSDLDLLYLGENPTDKFKEEIEIFPLKIHFIHINKKNFRNELNNPFIKEVFSKHVILHGTEEFIKLQKNTLVQ